MTLQDLANLGETIGGLAVFVTLVYLAVQVRQTRRELVRQNARDHVHRQNQFLSMAVDNPALMAVYVKVMNDFDACTREEKFSISLWLFTMSSMLEQAMTDLREGDLKGVELLGGHVEGLAMMLRSPGGSSLWEQLRFNFHPWFVDLVDQQIAKSDKNVLSQFDYPIPKV